jgi:hypothetical protein
LAYVAEQPVNCSSKAYTRQVSSRPIPPTILKPLALVETHSVGCSSKPTTKQVSSRLFPRRALQPLASGRSRGKRKNSAADALQPKRRLIAVTPNLDIVVPFSSRPITCACWWCFFRTVAGKEKVCWSEKKNQPCFVHLSRCLKKWLARSSVLLRRATLRTEVAIQAGIWIALVVAFFVMGQGSYSQAEV